jgi:hypothetical protein
MSLYGSVINVDGNPILGSFTVSLADAFASLADLGVPLSLPDTGEKAVSALISIETQDARVSFGGSGAGHVIATDASYSCDGPAAISAMRLANATAGSNSTAQITPFF